MPNYACIKDGVVVNTLVFGDDSDELREEVRITNDYDLIVVMTDDRTVVGDLYVNAEFVSTNAEPSVETTEESVPVDDPSEFPVG